MGQLPHSLMEGRVRERNRKINGKVENLVRTIDGTNVMRGMLKRLNNTEVILKLLGRRFPYHRSNKTI